MEEMTIPSDIPALYVEAGSFPNGVGKAHEDLRATLPAFGGRRFFGISWPNEKYEIVYKAAAQQLDARETDLPGLRVFTIRKGKYVCEVLKDWRNQEGQIKGVFERLLAYPGIAKDGYCLEEYLDDGSIRLMVTLA